jgi:hypothetical protein
MQIRVYNTDWIAVDEVDTIESMIWTDRYQEYGDFEIYTEINLATLNSFKMDYYLSMGKSEHIMIINSVEIKANTEFGNKLLIRGISLESILLRRIVWTQTILSGNLQTEIQRLLNENVISPVNTDRQIPNFVFQASTDPLVTSKTVDTQFTGDYVYDVISKLCKQNGIGFKITRSDSGQFIFKLYSGVDRSYEQLTNPFVVFSPNFDNIISSEYFESTENHKTSALIAGEGEGVDRITIDVDFPGDDVTGLERKEIYVDARDISSTVDGTPLTAEEYEDLLIYRGLIDLIEYRPFTSFEGKADSTKVHVYGLDFNIGDIVQTANEYGKEGRTMITEVTMSESESGFETFPTFVSI